MDHDYNSVNGLSQRCKRCGFRLTVVAQMVSTIQGGAQIPDCPAKNPVARGFDEETKKQFDIYDEKCHCDIRDLMTNGHLLGCPEKKR